MPLQKGSCHAWTEFNIDNCEFDPQNRDCTPNIFFWPFFFFPRFHPLTIARVAETHDQNATHCNTLQHTAAHFSTLQHTATHYIALQRIATHWNTLQFTTTHVITGRTSHCLEHQKLQVFQEKKISRGGQVIRLEGRHHIKSHRLDHQKLQVFRLEGRLAIDLIYVYKFSLERKISRGGG